MYILIDCCIVKEDSDTAGHNLWLRSNLMEVRFRMKLDKLADQMHGFLRSERGELGLPIRMTEAQTHIRPEAAPMPGRPSDKDQVWPVASGGYGWY